MRSDEVWFYSEGERLAATWRTPDDSGGPIPAVIQGPGWLGLRSARLYMRYHEALTAAGFGVLIFDYRGFGDSEGDRTKFSLRDQVQDLRNGVSYLTTREDVQPDVIGAFGSGGTGGGNAVMLAAADRRIRAAVSQLPVADGADWLHRMRSEHEWLDFLAMLDEDRRLRAVKGQGRLVHPREDVMVPTPERRATNVKADVDDRISREVSLSSADEILDYKPIVAARDLTTPLLVVAVENDATTPTDHATAIYEAAAGPKALLMQRHTTHYAAYDEYREVVIPRIVDWFRTYLLAGDIEIHANPGRVDRIDYVGGSSDD